METVLERCLRLQANPNIMRLTIVVPRWVGSLHKAYDPYCLDITYKDIKTLAYSSPALKRAFQIED